MGLGTFLPLGLMCFGCLSRLYYLSQHYLVVVVEAYNMCYEQAKVPVGFARLKGFPKSFEVPQFNTKLRYFHFTKLLLAALVVIFVCLFVLFSALPGHLQGLTTSEVLSPPLLFPHSMSTSVRVRAWVFWREVF